MGLKRLVRENGSIYYVDANTGKEVYVKGYSSAPAFSAPPYMLKNSGLAVLFSIFITGSGLFYCGAIALGLFFLIGQLVLITITIASATPAMWLITFIFGIIGVVVSYNKCEEYNANISMQYANSAGNMETPTRVQTVSDKGESILSRLQKAKKLFDDMILTKEEYARKKKELLSSIRKSELQVSEEEFLLQIAELKNKGIITAEDVQLVKNQLV